MVSRLPFCGKTRKIILAFDIGTTYSGISYCVLDPGVVPEVKGVTRFPANEQVTGASKIPTIIYYDSHGAVKAVGAEAMQEDICDQAEDEGWVKAEWFKLHLRNEAGLGAKSEVVNNLPNETDTGAEHEVDANLHHETDPGAEHEVDNEAGPGTEHEVVDSETDSDAEHEIVNNIPPLPLGKTVVDIFADFLAYLYSCAEAYIKESDVNGIALWKAVEGQIEFVLSHPNGWEGTQQGEMRKAAVQAGLVPDTPAGHARLSFVTEGEASLHYAIHNGLPDDVTKNGAGVVIVDAGGGTIDVSSYRSTSKDAFEEIAVPKCYFNGSVFVTLYAEVFLSELLEDSIYFNDLDYIVRCFDKTTKLRFRNADQMQHIKFGLTKDNDAARNIKHGQLKLRGSDVALFFENSINCVVQAVKRQQAAALRLRPTPIPVSHVVMVGGFSSSDWLYSQVSNALTPLGLHIIRPKNHVNKAVSDGAISFYLDHFVRSRVAKVTYGIFCPVPYDATNPEHVARQRNIFVSPSREKHVGGYFDVILSKNTQVSETKEFRKPYIRAQERRADFKNSSFEIWCYRGDKPSPKWKDVDPHKFTKLCTIKSDFSNPPSWRFKSWYLGWYYRLDHDIVLQFGLTELKAQVAWQEAGVEQRTPAEIVYDTKPSDTKL